MASNKKYDLDNGRQFTVLREVSEFSRTRVEIRCPFCGDLFWAYSWSLAGCGKKCPECGAMHRAGGSAFEVTK